MPEREQSAYRLALLIKKVRRQLSNAIRGELEPAGTSLPVVQIIKRIASGGDPSQLEVAQEIELEPAAFCRLVAELEEQRLVTRRRDPQDKRRMLMAVTPAGAALLDRTHPLVLAGIDEMFSRLTHAERGELCRLLEKLGDDAPEARSPKLGPRPRPSARPRSRRLPSRVR